MCYDLANIFKTNMIDALYGASFMSVMSQMPSVLKKRCTEKA